MADFGFSQRETPNEPQRRATESFAAANRFAYMLGAWLAFGCALFSGWSAYKISGAQPSGLVFAVAAGFIDFGKTFSLIQWGSFREKFGRDPLWLPIAQALFIVSVLWSFAAVLIFTYYTQNLMWGLVFAGSQFMATLLPGFGIHGGRTWEETRERTVIYPAGAAVPQAPVGYGQLPAPERQIRRADQIAPEAIEWLWPGMIPAADFTIIGGDSTAGKTTVCMSLAAAVSTGGQLPDGSRAPRGVSAVIEAEDDVASVTRPRLEAAGADLSRVHIIQHSSDELLTPEILDEYAAQIRGLSFLVLSPLRILMHDNQSTYKQVWGRLNAIVQWSRASGVAIIGVMHPPKGGKDSLAGSDAYRSLARSILYADTDPDKPGIRRLKLLISNIAAVPPAFPYRIASADVGGIETSRVIWLNRRELDDGRKVGNLTVAGAAGANNILAFPGADVAGVAAGAAPMNRGQFVGNLAGGATAEDWLRAFLQAGPALFQEIKDEGARAGYSERTLYAAGKALGVRKERGDGNRATWALPV